MSETTKPGAWVIYDYDHGPYAIALYADCEGAARGAAQRGYGKVGFWPFGEEFGDAMTAWEASE
jgi:hypothetical protein